MFHNLITSAFLKTGDKIRIAAPDRKVSMQKLKPSIKILESWVLHVVSGKNSLNSHIHLNFGIETLHVEMPLNLRKETIFDSKYTNPKKYYHGRTY